MKNVALRLRYDGSLYHGWQIQKNEISVAQTVEEALEKVLGTRTKVVGCGRTDAGVHALRYCANFHAETNIPMERMPLAVNSRLPDDIAVTDAVEVEEGFNAIGSTTVRTVYWCRAEKEGDIITVSICADGFLYNMCRAMVGTMVYASYGKLRPEDIPALLEKGDRRLTGPTMPPQGLYLNRVWYDGAAGEMMNRD